MLSPIRGVESYRVAERDRCSVVASQAESAVARVERDRCSVVASQAESACTSLFSYDLA